MRFSRNLLIFTLLLSLLLGIFLMPQFSIPVGDSTFTWPALDLTQFEVVSPFGNFRKGHEIYDGIQVTADVTFRDTQRVNFSEILSSDLEIIINRMLLSGLSDVDLIANESDGEHSVSFIFPSYYEDKNLDRIVSFLLSPGTFRIQEHDNEAAEGATVDETISEFFPGYVPVTSSIRPEDIQRISLITDARFGGNLIRIDFSQNAQSDIADAIARVDTSGDIKPPILTIDGVPQFTLLDIGEDFAMVSSALDQTTDLIQLRIVSQFASEEVGTRSTYSNLVTTEVPNFYASEGRTILAITFVVGALFLSLWSLRKFELIGGFTYLASLLTYLFYGLTLLKVAGMPISTGVLVGFAFMYLLGAIAIYDLMKVERALLEGRLKIYRDLAAFIFIMTGLLFSFGLAFGLFAEVIATVAFMSIGMFGSTVFGLRQILLNFHVNKNK